MNPADLSLLDQAIHNQLLLSRFIAGEQGKVYAVILQMQKELRLKLLGDLTDFGKARVNKLLSESTAIIEAAYKSVVPVTKQQWLVSYYKGKETERTIFHVGADTAAEANKIAADAVLRYTGKKKFTITKEDIPGTDLLGLARHEASATAQTFATIGLEAAIPTEAVLRALVNGSLIEGSPAAAWWAKQSDDLAFKFSAQVRQGIVQGETLMDIVRRVAGSPKLGVPGIFEVSRRNAGALVHTSIMQVASDARMAVYKANEDISKGYMHLSTLDGHVCPVCVARSGAQWDLNLKPIGGTKVQFQRTPIHMRCRCIILPILKSFRELGADIDEPPTGTRASDEGQVRADITMTEWLKGKPKAYVDDLLGVGRSDLFLKGKISLSDLVSQNGRKPLTLAELVAKHKT